MGSWRNEIRKLHWLWLQKYICVSNSLPPSSPSHERVSYGQDKWLLHCPFCSCDLNTYSSESNHLLRSTNQTESFCHLIFSHGLWIKPKLHLAYKEVPGPTFLSFRCLSLVLMKWKHRLPPPHLILVLVMWKHRLPPCFSNLPYSCQPRGFCAFSLFSAQNVLPCGKLSLVLLWDFCSGVNIIHAFPDSFFILGDFPCGQFLYNQGLSLFSLVFFLKPEIFEFIDFFEYLIC